MTPNILTVAAVSATIGIAFGQNLACFFNETSKWRCIWHFACLTIAMTAFCSFNGLF